MPVNDSPIEKARYKLVKLRALAAKPGTPAEGENAKARIEQILAKFPELRKAEPVTNTTFTWGSSAWRAAEDLKREEDLRRKRTQAQKRWEERQRNNDPMGQPMTAEERAKAQKDPFGWANAQDGRTHAQRQEDMNRSWGHGHDPKPKPKPEPKCDKPQTFYDHGGERRKRNLYVMSCEKCNGRLAPGEGAIMNVAGVWKAWCCETKPGPRRKKQGYER